MKQFTSHLDFSLSKKRLLMTTKKASRVKSASRSMFLIPILLGATVLFCTETKDRGNVWVNGIRVYIEPLLKIESFEQRDSESPFIHVLESNRYYTEEGKLFNGSRKTFDYYTDELLEEDFFKDGVLVRSESYSKRLSERLRTSYYLHKKGLLMEVQHYDWDGEVLSIRYNLLDGDIYIGSKTFNKDGQLIGEEIPHLLSENGRAIHRTWYDNGQLQTLMQSGEVGLEGLQTRYDREGNIISQDLYEKGKLISSL